ncbi:hypothetical protein BC828DRAFT_382580 [Blastocladiella britannica]|nr:hypothetical protein BC828DRAFT_382580 [Blastocladiella britannica]
MALNWTVLTPDGSQPLALPGERMYATFESVRLEFDSGGGYPGAGGRSFLVKRGTVYLTSARVEYVSAARLEEASRRAVSSSAVASSSSSAAAQGNGGAPFQSLSIPFANLRTPALHQPWFAGTYVELGVVPVLGGGLGDVLGTAKMYFGNGDAFAMYSQLAAAMDKALVGSTLGAPLAVVGADEPLPRYDGGDQVQSSSVAATPAPVAVPAPSVPQQQQYQQDQEEHHRSEAPPGYF